MRFSVLWQNTQKQRAPQILRLPCPAENMQQLLSSLEERDRQLIFLRYYRRKTQTEVARRLGMTQVQVSRREKRILQSMRQQLLD